MDLKKDSVFGISMERTYSELLKGKTPVSVIVAVIDGGVEINHPDLKSVIYTNKAEIPGNGKDDDGNGYIDDVQGWNFLGSSKGSFIYDNSDGIRQLRIEMAKNPASAEAADLKAQIQQKRSALTDWLKRLEPEKNALDNIRKSIGIEKPTVEDIKAYKPTTYAEGDVLVSIVKALKGGTSFKTYCENFDARYLTGQNNLAYQVSPGYDPRRNNPEFKGNHYGNPDVGALNPFHGTHVAGILAADRNNEAGIKGVADNVMILPIRAVPDGDFRDIDLVNAIRYAVDMGAKVINMSIVKSTVIDRASIDDAIRYAVSKDVLMVHGAGNTGIEQREDSYPNKKYADGREAAGWIEVAASGWKDDAKLIPWFSNYGAKSVDVFAPGLQIYSTWTNHSYITESGTSMAAPVVAGLAAVIRGYYPKLTALQVKEIIMKSVVKRDVLKDKCITGGVVNAYQALQLADHISKK